MVILDAIGEDLILVLVFGDVAVDPIFSLQIILVLILAEINQPCGSLRLDRFRYIRTAGLADFIDDAYIVLLLQDSLVEVS